ASPSVAKRQRLLDRRPDTCADAEPKQLLQLLERAHRRADHGQLPEVDVSERIECVQVAAPTVSMTASTRSGSRASGSNASFAPSSSARARRSGERLV